MSPKFGKNCLFTAALLHRSQSSCQLSVASSSSSLYGVILGNLSKTTRISLTISAPLAKRSASSLPILPAWALFHLNPIVHLELQRVIILFLISSK